MTKNPIFDSMKQILPVLLLSIALQAAAQGPAETLSARLAAQAEAWQQEKLYILPAAEEFLPGERIWLKVHIVDACRLQNIDGSRYAYVELADTTGLVRSRVKLMERGGLYEGYLDIPEELADGIYYLRAYTRYAEATPWNEAVRPVQIGRPKAYVRETPAPADTGLVRIFPAGFRRKALQVQDGRYYLVGTCRMEPFHFGGISASQPVIVENIPEGHVRFYALDRNFRVAGKADFMNPGYERSLPVPMQLLQDRDSCRILLNMAGLAPGEVADLTLAVSRSFHPFGEDIETVLPGSDPEAGLDMTAVFQGRTQNPPAPQENSQTLTGHVETALFGRPAADAEVRLIAPKVGQFAIVRSDGNGDFRFEGLDDPEGTGYVLTALDNKGRENVVPSVEEPVFPAFPPIPYRFREVTDTVTVLYGGIDVAETVELEGAVLRTEVEDPQVKGLTALADFTFGPKQIEAMGATCLQDVLLRVPGVFLRKDESGQENCYIRTATSILADHPAAIAIDGLILDGIFDLDIIEMPIVERIDIYKTGQTAIWGSRGGSGVISITTKQGDFNPASIPDRFNICKVRLPGYQRPVRFRPDARTLYWNPSIRSDRLSFPVKGAHGEWHILLEGVTSQGRLVHEEAILSLE